MQLVASFALLAIAIFFAFVAPVRTGGDPAFPDTDSRAGVIIGQLAVCAAFLAGLML